MGQPLALIVDRDKRRRAMLSRRLRRICLSSRYSSTLREAQDCLSRENYQLVVMYLNGEPQKAYQFCRKAYKADPNVTLVAALPSMDIKVEGRLLDCGVREVAVADQIEPDIFHKKIFPHLQTRLNDLSQPQHVRLDGTLVDFDCHEVWCKGQRRDLSGISAKLLRYFLENSNRIISRDELRKSHIWQEFIHPSSKGGKAVDMAVFRLRKVIEPNPRNPRIILSVPGRGFRLGPGILN